MHILCNIIMILGRTQVLYPSKMLVLLQYDKKKKSIGARTCKQLFSPKR